MKHLRISLLFALTAIVLLSAGCKIYRFRDVNIDPDIKTVKLNYIENKARYKNPQLSPQLTDKLRQKINNQTSLTQIQGDDANLEITGSITDYSTTTSGISNQQAASNRLTVSVSITIKNRLDDKKSREESVSRNFDFSANLTLDQAEAQLNSTIIQNLTDEIFNRIFSNW
ncbi:MAG: LptE family protein [Chitinophagaceae bacterium]